MLTGDDGKRKSSTQSRRCKSIDENRTIEIKTGKQLLMLEKDLNEKKTRTIHKKN